MTRIEGGVSLNVQFTAEGAGAAGDIARPARPGASASGAAAAAVASAPATAEARYRYMPVPMGRPSNLWLVAKELSGITRARAGYAPELTARPSVSATGSAASEKATVTSPLDFLRDSRLTAEEKLVLLLAQQQKDVEKEIETVLKKAEAKSAQKKKSGGLLKKFSLGDFLKTAVPGLSLVDQVLKIPAIAKAVSQISGPVLAAGATALGMPHLAPLAMSVGADLVNAALDTELPFTEAEAKATANAPNAGTGSSTALDPVETQRLTLLVNRQQQWSGTVSNLLHGMHQTRMNVIQNLR